MRQPSSPVSKVRWLALPAWGIIMRVCLIISVVGLIYGYVAFYAPHRSCRQRFLQEYPSGFLPLVEHYYGSFRYYSPETHWEVSIYHLPHVHCVEQISEQWEF